MPLDDVQVRRTLVTGYPQLQKHEPKSPKRALYMENEAVDKEVQIQTPHWKNR